MELTIAIAPLKALPVYMYDLADTAKLAADLVAIPSPSGDETAVLQALQTSMVPNALKCRRIPVDNNRYNLLITSDQTPRVLLTTHVDTVPGPATPSFKKQKLWGRGSCDAKGIAAAMLGALHDLLPYQLPVALLLVVGEETCSDGAKAAAKALDPVRYFINGEPTELTYVKAQRGALAFRLTAHGTAAHSGYPELGESAVHKLLECLHALMLEAWPGDPNIGPTLINIGTITGGSAANVLAEQAQASVMMRVATSVEAIKQRVQALTAPDVTMEISTASDPQMLYVPDGAESVVVGFASDVAHLRPLGTPIMIGPGSIHHAHTDHEHVALDDLARARLLYAELCQKLLQEPLP